MRSLSKTTTVFTMGVYDLFHVGHLILLEKSSLLGDKLIVGVVSDSAVKKFKGDGRPIMNQNDRIKIISNLKFVDEVVLVKEFNPLPIFEEQMKKSTTYNNSYINIYVRGEDQTHINLEEIEKKYNPIIVTIGRTSGVSTSDTIKKLGESNDSNK